MVGISWSKLQFFIHHDSIHGVKDRSAFVNNVCCLRTVFWGTQRLGEIMGFHGDFLRSKALLGDYTTQYIGDYHKPLWEPLSTRKKWVGGGFWTMLACSNRQSLRIAWKEHWNWNFQFTFRGWLWLYSLCRISQINTLTSWAIIDYWLVLKNDGVRQLGWLFPYTTEKMFETTNQIDYITFKKTICLYPHGDQSWKFLVKATRSLSSPVKCVLLEFQPMNFRPGIKQHLTINYRDFDRDYQSSFIRIIASSWNKSWNM